MTQIRFNHAAVQQAGTDMNLASATTSEVLGSVSSVSHPAGEAAFGDPVTTAHFGHFWRHMRQQVQLAGDIFGELGKGMGGAAAAMPGADNAAAKNLNGAAGSGAITPPPIAPPGADGDVPPVISGPPPPDDPPPPGAGAIVAPGGVN